MSSTPTAPAVPGPSQPSREPSREPGHEPGHDPERETEVPSNDPADPLPAAEPAQPS